MLNNVEDDADISFNSMVNGDFWAPEFHWAVYDDLCTNCVKKLLRIEENQS